MGVSEGAFECTDVPIVASAVSVKRTVGAQVDANGMVVAVRFLSTEVRAWDAYTLGQRVVAVADVAHDRYLSNQPDPDGGQYPTREAVAAAERRLKF
ncbi:hypothetical protein [Mycobacterium sp. TY815]|uniref:hypothetical protein n=1 Tax=Mycobacterium sp. TY815 TaxID=3050581 RepID=UPI0027414FF0|nr:hypothetical protein [Mycobacterium sp. TY815]MDP7707392.1 hypothetical protein [Mycobacterium sp. TY815]